MDIRENINNILFVIFYSERFYLRDVPHVDYGVKHLDITFHGTYVEKASDGYWYILLDDGQFLFSTSEFYSVKLIKVTIALRF